MWPFILSDRLPIEALVGHYPANKLMGREFIPKRPKPFIQSRCRIWMVSGISTTLVVLFQT